MSARYDLDGKPELSYIYKDGEKVAYYNDGNVELAKPYVDLEKRNKTIVGVGLMLLGILALMSLMYCPRSDDVKEIIGVFNKKENLDWLSILSMLF